MQASDLRIGNKIIANGLFGGQIVTVEQIGTKGRLRDEMRVIMFQEREDVGEFVKDCEGIELSPSILEACGFEKVFYTDGAEYFQRDEANYEGADFRRTNLATWKCFRFRQYKNDWILEIHKSNRGHEFCYQETVNELHRLQNVFYFSELSVNLPQTVKE